MGEAGEKASDREAERETGGGGGAYTGAIAATTSDASQAIRYAMSPPFDMPVWYTLSASNNPAITSATLVTFSVRVGLGRFRITVRVRVRIG